METGALDLLTTLTHCEALKASTVVPSKAMLLAERITDPVCVAPASINPEGQFESYGSPRWSVEIPAGCVCQPANGRIRPASKTDRRETRRQRDAKQLETWGTTFMVPLMGKIMFWGNPVQLDQGRHRGKPENCWKISSGLQCRRTETLPGNR